MALIKDPSSSDSSQSQAREIMGEKSVMRLWDGFLHKKLGIILFSKHLLRAKHRPHETLCWNWRSRNLFLPGSSPGAASWASSWPLHQQWHFPFSSPVLAGSDSKTERNRLVRMQMEHVNTFPNPQYYPGKHHGISKPISLVRHIYAEPVHLHTWSSSCWKVFG